LIEKPYGLRRIVVSENMVNCIKIMYESTKFCVKCGENEVTTFAPQTSGVRQGCSLSPYLFNIFINDIMEYINVDNSHAPSIGRTTFPGLLLADDLAVSSFTSNGLQKEIDQIVRYCKEWNLKRNFSKSKIAVFKKGGKLKNSKRSSMGGQNIEIIDKFKYLGITSEDTGGWKNQKASIKAKGNQTLTAIDKCLATTPNMKVRTLENLYEMLCESR
jgi:hypothetical protein